MWMQACSYLCGAFREINIWEHSVKWSSLNKSPWHNKHFWHMGTPPPPPTPLHPQLASPGAQPPFARMHINTHSRHTVLSDTTYLSPPLLVLPNGASPQASKSNPSTNTVGIYLEWAFVLFNGWLLGRLGHFINSAQVVSVCRLSVCCPLYPPWTFLSTLLLLTVLMLDICSLFFRIRI